MGQFDLNLSTRPFKPYRAVNLGLFAVLLILLAISAAQFLNYQEYSTRASAAREEEQKARAEASSATTQLQSLNDGLKKNNADVKISEVEALNKLLLRKSFSWTSVFANLERIMPENVRLVSLHPFLDEHGRIGLNINIRGRSFNDAAQFLRILEESRIFTDVALAAEQKIEKKDAKDPAAPGEVEFVLSSYYDQPQAVAKPVAKTAATTAAKGTK
jgi:Tfp pilus assembly protein PilN